MPDFPSHSLLKVNTAFSVHKFSDKFSGFSEIVFTSTQPFHL